MNKPIIVQHSGGSYPIYFASQLNEHIESLRALLQDADSFVIIINQQVSKLYAKEIGNFVTKLGCQHPPLIIADGEEHKNITTMEGICTDLSKMGLSRQSCLIAIGGGVTTDIIGYVAASYMRGINFIQVPTTLLAQVDASIGGKTGVNLPSGKNLVGAFHQPQAVLITEGFLSQLPQDEISCGFAEIIKHALLADEKFFGLLENYIDPPTHNVKPGVSNPNTPNSINDIIRHACQIKVDIVQQDEREMSGSGGKRALLNLGHTFAHALEGMAQYKSLKHGQAVAVGLVIASRISQQLGHISKDDCLRIQNLLAQAGLPMSPTEYFADDSAIDAALEFIMRDKKKHASRIPLILLKQIGQSYISQPYSKEEIKGMLIHALAYD